jgi:nicotinate-nucleotide adenylyltransferase
MENKIAVYGGAFNPPTLWHEKVISGLLTSKQVEKIILSPDGYRLDKNYGISQEKRKKIIDIFIESLLKKWLNVEIDTHFLEGKNWDFTSTIEVDKYFKEKLWFSPYHIFWSDVIKNMKNWSGNNDEFIEKKLNKLFISRPWYELTLENIDNYLLADLPDLIEISSTVVRNMLSVKKNVNAIITAEISEYIQNNNISYM